MKTHYLNLIYINLFRIGLSVFSIFILDCYFVIHKVMHSFTAEWIKQKSKKWI